MSSELEPSKAMRHFFVKGQRHDRSRVEIQLGFDGELEDALPKSLRYDVNFLIFYPRSWGMADFDLKKLITSDTQSYVRLHTQTSNPKFQKAQDRVMARFQQLKEQKSQKAVRLLGNDLLGLISGELGRVAKLIRRVGRGRLLAELAMADVSDRLLRDYRLLGTLRELIDTISTIPTTGSINGSGHSSSHNSGNETWADQVVDDLNRLNEYVSHLYVQGLGDILNELRRVGQLGELRLMIDEMLHKEFEARKKFGFYIESSDSSAHSQNDTYLYRTSLLKKYFQRDLFIQAARTETEDRITYPVYALAAAIAASWALIIQQWMAVSYAVNPNQLLPTAIVVTAIVGYIVKDILKDVARKKLLKVGVTWLPLFVRDLIVRDEAEQRKVGRIREYVRLLKPNQLPPQLAEARYQNDEFGPLERAITEDIVHFRKKVELHVGDLQGKDQFPWGFREIIRFSLGRIRNSTDDSYKDIFFLNDQGLAVKKPAHRLYQVHLLAWIQVVDKKKKTGAAPQAFRAFRVDLDKDDIASVHNLKWHKRGAIPPLPG